MIDYLTAWLNSWNELRKNAHPKRDERDARGATQIPVKKTDA